MRRWLWAVVSLAVVLGACAPGGGGAPNAPPSGGAPSSGAPPSAASAPAASAAPTTAPPPRRRIKVAWVAASPAQSPPWISLERGLYEKYGLEPELVRIAGGEAIKALVAGDLDFAFGPAGTTALARVNGGDVAIVGSMIHTLPYEVWANPDVPTPADLRGKRLAINRLGTTTDFVARFALRRWNLEADRDVALIQVGESGEMLAALERGAIDAAVVEELFGLAAAKMPRLHRLVNVHDLGLQYMFGGIETRRSLIASEPATVLNFMRATVEAISIFKQEREFTLGILAKYTQLDDPAVLATSWELHTRYFQQLPYPIREGYQLIVEEQVAVEPRIRDLDPADLIDDRFVRELDQSGFAVALYR